MKCENCEYYNGDCTVKNKRRWVIESYCDEYKTLQQCFIYDYGNNRERQFRIKQLNPNMKIHLYTRYLDEHHSIICTKWEGPEELKGEIL